MNFYLPNLNTKTVNNMESAHFFSMRVKVGDEVKLTNLKGQLQKVKITYVDKKIQKIAWEVLKSETIKKPNGQVLFQASTDRIYLEKLAEILSFSGFSQIYLYQAERTPKQNIAIERLHKILIRGCELAELTWMPSLEIIKNEAEFEELLRIHKPVVLEQQDRKNNPLTARPNACLVGPEGGWGGKELKLFEVLNLHFKNLGSTVFPAWLAGFAWNQRQL